MFNRDDLNTWIDVSFFSEYYNEDYSIFVQLLAAADQFLLLPLKNQCERMLSEKIDAEVTLVIATYSLCIIHN